MKKSRRVLLLLPIAFILACSTKPLPSDLLNELIQKQQRERITIGWMDGSQLEIVIFGKNPTMRSYSVPGPRLFAATLDGDTGRIFGTLADPKQNQLIAVRDGNVLWQASDLAVHQNPVVALKGDRLAVYGRDKKSGVDGLYLVEDQGRKITLVSRNAEGASWSPDGSKLLYSEGNRIMTYDLQSKECVPLADGTLARWSPDSKWITYRTPGNKFILADTNGKIERTLLDGKEIVTGLSWSPDSQFLMYVEKAGAWEGGDCARNMADGRNVMVYRLRDGQRGEVFQVCDGFPYQQLDWLRVPSNLPLS